MLAGSRLTIRRGLVCHGSRQVAANRQRRQCGHVPPPRPGSISDNIMGATVNIATWPLSLVDKMPVIDTGTVGTKVALSIDDSDGFDAAGTEADDFIGPG